MTAQSSRPTSKSAWKKRNDRGPHTATLPSGAVVKFMIPDSGMLLRSGRLPERLKETALLVAAHPRGADGYMEELVTTAIIAGERSETISRAIEQGMDLGHFLVAEMLVEPEVTSEEVADGDFHEFDIRMLLAFAERRLNVDAAGKKLPIIVLDEWATFRNQPASPTGAADGGANGDVDPGALPDADAGDV